METEAIKRDILDIPALVLPAVLITEKRDGACILLGVDHANCTQSVKVLDPLERSHPPRLLRIKAMATEYTGHAFLVRAAAEGLTPVPSPQETCREITGFGRSSKCIGAAMDTLPSPPS